MERTKDNDKRTIIIFCLTVFFTAAIFLIFMAVSGVFPFGASSLLRNDAEAQYVPFLREYMTRIKDGSSLLYSFYDGGGTNFYSTFCYYLMNPFNLLSLLFSVDHFDRAFTFIIFVQTLFIALSICTYLTKKFKRNDLSVVVFSLLYTFCGFYMAYYYNTMWLTAIMLLPMIALGIEKIVHGKTGWLYFGALAFAILTNFYMGYMLCLFSVLYFLVLLFSNPVTSKTEKGNLESKADAEEAPVGKVLVNFAVFSLFAGLVCAVVLIPIYCSLQAATAKQVFSDKGFFFNFLDFLSAHLSGATIPGITIKTSDTLPNLSCGMLSFCLVPLYLFTKKIRLNEKIANGILLLLLFLSFQLPDLNIIWHGFAMPSGLPYRFAYIYSFLLIVIAYKTFIHIKEVPLWAFVFPVVLSGAAIIYSHYSSFASTLFSTKTIVLSACAAVIYLVVLILKKYEKLNAKVLSSLLLVAVLAETVVGQYGNFISRAESIEELYPNISTAKNAVADTKVNDSSLFYRFENSSSPSTMMFTGLFSEAYSSSSFSSLNDSKYSNLQYNLGLQGNITNAYNYSAQTAVYNSLFNIKYVLDTNDSFSENNPYYEKVGEYDGHSLYKSLYSGSLGYVCNEDIVDYDANGLAFTNQNNLWEALTGSEKAFSTVDPTSVSYQSGYGVSISEFSAFADNSNAATLAAEEAEHDHSEEGEDHHDLEYNDIIDIAKQMGGMYLFKATDDDYAVEFTFTAEKDGEMYLNQQVTSLTKLDVAFSDGSVSSYSIGADNSIGRYIVDIGYLKAGESITVKFSEPDRALSEFDDSVPITDSIFIEAATLSDEAFQKGYNQLTENGLLNITEFDEDKISGTVNATKDGIMMMSMPYDKGWTVLVDGVETELVENNNNILMFDIAAGEHTIEMKYVPVGLKEGAFVSAASVVALILIALLMNMRKNRGPDFPEENPDAEFVKKEEPDKKED